MHLARALYWSLRGGLIVLILEYAMRRRIVAELKSQPSLEIAPGGPKPCQPWVTNQLEHLFYPGRGDLPPVDTLTRVDAISQNFFYACV
jgi:hypothetical protein